MLSHAPDGSHRGESFSRALQECRVRQPGTPDQRRAAPPERPTIRACLATKGWNPDGSPTLDAMLGDPEPGDRDSTEHPDRRARSKP